jgi:hypothetical protein
MRQAVLVLSSALLVAPLAACGTQPQQQSRRSSSSSPSPENAGTPGAEASASSESTAAQEDDELSYSTVEVETPAELVAQLEKAASASRARSFASSESADNGGSPTISTQSVIVAAALLSNIVNAANASWSVVAQNRPAVNVKSTFASAVPDTSSGEFSLQGFSPVQYKTYRRTAYSSLGLTAYDVTYTVVHQYGGNVRGTGHYLTSVSVIPNSVYVGFGSGLSISVDGAAASNIGTEDDPIGYLVMPVSFTHQGWISSTQKTEIYEFRGDSSEFSVR